MNLLLDRRGSRRGLCRDRTLSWHFASFFGGRRDVGCSPRRCGIGLDLCRRQFFGRFRFGGLRFGRLRFGRLRFGRFRFGRFRFGRFRGFCAWRHRCIFNCIDWRRRLARCKWSLLGRGIRRRLRIGCDRLGVCLRQGRSRGRGRCQFRIGSGFRFAGFVVVSHKCLSLAMRPLVATCCSAQIGRNEAKSSKIVQCSNFWTDWGFITVFPPYGGRPLCSFCFRNGASDQGAMT